MRACEFRDIPGFDGYMASSDGHIWSCLHARGKRDSYRKLKPSANAKGYLGLSLSSGGSPISLRVHRLVAITFLPNPEGHPCVRHKDGNPANNAVANLAWSTYSENEQDKKAHGTWWSRRFGSKLKEEDRRLVRKMRSDGASHKRIAAAFGVSQSTISRLLAGRTWRDECAGL